MTKKLYNPSQKVIDKAHIKDWDKLNDSAQADPEQFWTGMADELHWHKKWDKYIDDSNAPFYKFFVGAQTNITYNCLDVHLTTSNRNKIAYIWESEQGETKSISYFALHREVSKFSNVLKSFGVNKGDRVTIYMGRVMEQVIAMLACARIGAVHSVVYGGFSTEALHERIENSQSKVLITCDGSYQRGKVVELKKIANEAADRSGYVNTIICVQRVKNEVEMVAGRDHWYHKLMDMPIASSKCEAEILDAEDPLFMLYTSGTTGKPKAILHTHGGYMVGTYTSLKYVFDIHDEDRYWCAADPG
ncbi:MAG: AMP-binding protein, partial [Candidatus Kapaibacterium sp.]